MWAITAEPISGEEYHNHVGDAVALLRAGLLRKVVLARGHREEYDQQPDIKNILAALASDAAPQTWCYAIDIAADRTFVGATPEVLFQLDGNTLHTMALAGSRPTGNDTAGHQRISQRITVGYQRAQRTQFSGGTHC